MGSHHRPSDYRFARQRSDGLPLEKSPLPFPRRRRLVAGLLFALASFALMAAINGLGAWLLE